MTESEAEPRRPRATGSIDGIDGIDGVDAIDVIVPVHGAGPAFRRCAASVIAHAGEVRAVGGAGGEQRDVPASDTVAVNAAADAPRVDSAVRLAPFRLVVVLDGPPDAESRVAVEELRAAARGGVDVDGGLGGGQGGGGAGGRAGAGATSSWRS